MKKEESLSLVKEVIGIFDSYARPSDTDAGRLYNCGVACVILGATLSVLSKFANPKDCIEIVHRGMKNVGWIKYNG